MTDRTIRGPKGLPIFGIAPEAQRDMPGTLLRLVVEYGDVVRVPLPGIGGYLLADPELVKTALLDSEKTFIKPKATVERLSVLLGQGLVTSGGSLWRRQRRLASPAFSRQAMERVVPLVTHATGRMLERWDAIASRGGRVEIVSEMMHLALQVVIQFLFSTDIGPYSAQIRESLAELEDYFNVIATSPVVIPLDIPTPRNIRARKHRNRIHSIIDTVIAARRRLPPEERPQDLLSSFMSATLEETGESMSDSLLRDELMTMFFAGHDTTANGLAFALYLLSSYPEWGRRLEAEASRVLSGRSPTIEDLQALEQTRMVFAETLRLYPPAHLFIRESLVDLDYRGDRIPARSNLLISPYALHRNPRLWDNAEGFDPERFSEERSAQRHKFAYLPFGHGPRMCIGAGLAQIEAPLILAMLAQRFRLQTVPGQTLRHKASITLTPDPGIDMYVQRR